MQTSPETAAARYTIVYYGPSQMGKFKLITAVQKYLPPELVHEGAKVDGATPPRLALCCSLPRAGRDAPPVTLTLKTLADPAPDPHEWDALLQEADAILVVAEASPSRLDENVKSLNYLQQILAAQRRDPRRFPLALQYYRRNLPSDEAGGGDLPSATLDEHLRPIEWPRFETSGAPIPQLLAPLYALYELLRRPRTLEVPEQEQPSAPEPQRRWWNRLRGSSATK